MVVLDKLGLWFRMLALLTALIGIVFAANYIEEKGMPLGDFYAVLALATLGMMIVGALAGPDRHLRRHRAARPSRTYIMTGFARNNRLSNEAALKYFLLGTFATAILVYGMAWLYGMTGSTNLPLIARQVRALVAAHQASYGGLLLAIAAAGRRPRLQGRRRAVPYVDARRLPGRAHAGDGDHVGGPEGGRASRPSCAS